MQKNTRAARSKANPTARESDVTSDPAYKQKVAFYEHLETQLNAHILDLQRKAETDINAFQRLISIQITQLSSQIQNMKMSDFIQEFGYILDGNTLQRDVDSDADKQKTTRIVRHLDCFSKVKAAEDASAAIHVDLKRNDDGQYIPQLCCNDQMYSLTSETISEMDPSTLNNITSQIEIILQTLENAKNKLKTK